MSNNELFLFTKDRSSSLRHGASAAVVNNHIIVIGGYCDNNNNGKSDNNNSIFLNLQCIDINSADYISCLVTTSNAHNRCYHSSSVANINNNNKIYVFGGLIKLNGILNISQDILEVEYNRFGIFAEPLQCSSKPLVGRYGLTSHAFGDKLDRIIIYGGINELNANKSSAATAANSVGTTTSTSATTATNAATSAKTMNANVTGFKCSSDVVVFNPSNATAAATTSSSAAAATAVDTSLVKISIEGTDKPVDRAFHSSCICGSNSNLLVVYGGQAENKALLNDLWILDLTEIVNAINNGVSLVADVPTTATAPPTKGSKNTPVVTTPIPVARWYRVLTTADNLICSPRYMHTSYAVTENATGNVEFYVFGGVGSKGPMSLSRQYRCMIKRIDVGKYSGNSFEVIDAIGHEDLDINYTIHSAYALPLIDISTVTTTTPAGIIILGGDRSHISSSSITRFEYVSNDLYIQPLMKESSLINRILSTIEERNRSNVIRSNTDINKSHHIEYPNGDIYDGLVLYRDDQPTDIPQGFGKMLYADGGIYEGMWNDGNKHGEGKLRLNDDSTYIGMFKDDQQNGEGVITFANTSSYQGRFANNMYSGNGKYIDENGNTFVGEFENSLYHGEGILYGKDGSEQNGLWFEGKMSGYGYANKLALESINSSLNKVIDDNDFSVEKLQKLSKLKISNHINMNQKNKGEEELSPFMKRLTLSGRYTGPLLNGLPSGPLGVCDYEDNSQYSGEWKVGKKNGLGSYMYANDDKYHGKWVGDKRCGWGKLEASMNDSINNSYEGIWYNNVPHGEGVMHYKNGTSYIGEFKNGRKHGFGKIIKLDNYDSEHLLYEGEWRDDHTLVSDA